MQIWNRFAALSLSLVIACVAVAVGPASPSSDVFSESLGVSVDCATFEVLVAAGIESPDGLPPCTDGKVRVMTIGDCWGARLHVAQVDYEAWKSRIKGNVITLVDCEEPCDIGTRYWHRTECQGVVGAWFYLVGWECVEPEKVAKADRLPWIPATPCVGKMSYERICRCFDQLGPCPPGSPGF